MIRTEIVICGAGIAGIAAAYELSVVRGQRDVLLVDELPPLTLTSDKSTECYRNWWPGPGDAMVRLMDRSIDRLEDLARRTGNVFLMNRRGYLYASAREEQVDLFRDAAEEAASLGAGPLRMHEGAAADYRPAPPTGFEEQPDGADVIEGRAAVARLFPWLSPDTAAVLHARRCGWLSAQQLGMCLLGSGTGRRHAAPARAHRRGRHQGRPHPVAARGVRRGGRRGSTPPGSSWRQDRSSTPSVNASVSIFPSSPSATSR